MSNNQSIIEKLIVKMKSCPGDATDAVLRTGELPKELCDRWVTIIAERPVRALLGRTKCPEWEEWATQFLAGNSTEALADQAAVKADEWGDRLKEARKDIRGDGEFSKPMSSEFIASASRCIAEAIGMWHGGDMEDVELNVGMSEGYEAVANLIAASPATEHLGVPFFQSLCSLSEQKNEFFMRAVLYGALDEGAEARAKRAEARAKEAEARAKEAEVKAIVKAEKDRVKAGVGAAILEGLYRDANGDWEGFLRRVRESENPEISGIGNHAANIAFALIEVIIQS